METLLSIIVPMYNVENYLIDCIGNIKIEDIDYEIVMVNDGSPDNSFEVAKSLALTNSRIKVVSQENKGLGGARNLGINVAIGKYILFLDADDILVKQNYVFLKNTEEDIIEFSSKNIKSFEETLSTFKAENISSMRGIEYCLNFPTMFSACNKLYKRNYLIENDLSFRENIYIEDFEFNTRVFFLANSVSSKEEYIQYFFQSPNSITRNNNFSKKKKLVSDMVMIVEHIYNFKQQYELSIESNRYFNVRLTYLCTDIIYHTIKNKLPSEFLKENINFLYSKNFFYLQEHLTNRRKEFFRKLIKHPVILSSLVQVYNVFY